MDPNGKVVIVTGAGSGLGLATCKVFAAAGAKVYGFDRDAARLTQIEGEAPGALTAMAVDVSSESSVRDAIAKVVAAAGALHVAVNCAGILKAAKRSARAASFRSRPGTR